jgi:hypothetical protein
MIPSRFAFTFLLRFRRGVTPRPYRLDLIKTPAAVHPLHGERAVIRHDAGYPALIFALVDQAASEGRLPSFLAAGDG